MIDSESVPSSIQGEGKADYHISVDFVVEAKEVAKASACKDAMCQFGENVIA
jgi:hypothetical protein